MPRHRRRVHPGQRADILPPPQVSHALPPVHLSPTVIFPSFGLTPGATPLPTMTRLPEQGKGLDDMLQKYSTWFSPHLHEFAGHVYRLPFDQHWLMALAAPRTFISLEGTEDQNCLPSSVKAARHAATARCR